MTKITDGNLARVAEIDALYQNAGIKVARDQVQTIYQTMQSADFIIQAWEQDQLVGQLCLYSNEVAEVIVSQETSVTNVANVLISRAKNKLPELNLRLLPQKKHHNQKNFKD
ncbi:hypothetical protein [Lentilactobacillus sp. Marseille-Q4993]|uniref:hypothetical protein n=1 Tax=Lentilactobacillus sp. Marseille-Q4993 TaxID=3039492 RepID=UPI0024BD3CB3|nr:hypothetical protein [Lentilactobacillus sp. Marseille-Q4993]